MAIKLHKEQEKFAYKKYVSKFYFYGSNLTIYQNILNLMFKFKKNIKTYLSCKKNTLFKILHIPKRLDSEKINFEFNVDLSDSMIKNYPKSLYENKYLFIENILTKQSYDALLNDWPKSFYFNPMGKIIKEYNWGFVHKRKTTNFNFEKGDIKKNVVLKNFYQFLISQKFSNFINKLLKYEKNEYEINSILSTTAKGGSFLIPHVDNIQKTERTDSYNCIFFLDGDDKNLDTCGATSIYNDNNFKDLIFQPQNLKNSMLVYNSTNDFFHGFKYTNKQMKERKTVNFHFLKKE